MAVLMQDGCLRLSTRSTGKDDCATVVRDAIGRGALHSLFAAEGGRSVSERKADAARANGAKGGRPKKGRRLGQP